MRIKLHDILLALILGFLIAASYYTVRELRTFNAQVQDIKKALGGDLFGVGP